MKSYRPQRPCIWCHCRRQSENSGSRRAPLRSVVPWTHSERWQVPPVKKETQKNVKHSCSRKKINQLFKKTQEKISQMSSFCFARKVKYASMSSFIIPNLPALEMRQLAWAHLTVNVIPVDSCSRCWRSPGDSSNRPVQTWPSAGWPRGGSTDCVASLATLGVTTVWVCQAQTRKTTESCCPSSPVKVKLKYENHDLHECLYNTEAQFYFRPQMF